MNKYVKFSMEILWEITCDSMPNTVANVNG